MTADASTPDPRPQTPDPVAATDWLSPRRFALVLAALLAVTFWRVLFGGEAFFYRDYGFLGYPFAYFHRECFWSGDFFPLWNPYVNCGAPFLAQWNTLCLYPGALIYLLLPLPWSLGFFCVAHLFLGGMGMRALAERWTGSRFGAAVAGVAFVFSGLVLGCIIYPNYLVALGWMPWVVLATRRAWQTGGRSLVLAALAGAMQMLSGAPEIILLTWGFLAALAVVDWVQSPRSKVQGPLAQGSGGEQGDSSLTPALSRWEREGASAVTDSNCAPLTKPALGDSASKSEAASLNPMLEASPPLPAGEGRGEGERVPTPTPSFSAHEPPTPLITNHFSLLTRFLSVIALITGLCAAQLLPFFQLLSLSQRSGDAVNTFWSLPGWGWVNLFFPLFMNFQTDQGVFVMISQAFFPSIYLGLVPLTLALLAVWRIGLRGAEEPAVVGRGVLTPPSDTRSPQDLGGALGTARPTSAVWEVRLLAGATLLSVLLAFGDNFVLWGWLREVLPLGIMRFPVKALLLAAFTVPLLAAWGVRWLETTAQAILDEEQSAPTGFKPAGNWRLLCLAVFVVSLFSWLVAVVAVFIPRTRKRALELHERVCGAGMGAFSAWEGRSEKPGWRDVILLITLLLVSTLALAFIAFRFPLLKTPLLAIEHDTIATGLWACAITWIIGSTCFARLTPLAKFGPALVALLLAICSQRTPLNPTISAAAFEPGLAAAYHASKGALTPAPKLGESRIMLSPLAERALHTRMVPKFYDDFIGQRLAFWGNLNLLDGLPKVNGASTLVTREWNEVEYFLYGTTNPAPANLMDFLGVTHTTKPGELMQWERRTNAMPLVSFPAVTVSAEQPGQALKAMMSPDWDPQREVFIAGLPVTGSGGVKWEAGPPDIAVLVGSARVTSFGTKRVELEVRVNAAHGLVIAQNFYPSWRATVNGQPAPVLRANHAFQAIPIPFDRSTVRLDYVDWPFRIGSLISVATALGCLLWWRFGRACPVLPATQPEPHAET